MNFKKIEKATEFVNEIKNLKETKENLKKFTSGITRISDHISDRCLWVPKGLDKSLRYLLISMIDEKIKLLEMEVEKI